MSKVNSVWLNVLRTANRQTKDMRALRQLAIKFYSSVARANVFLPPPRVMLNGLGKSGTHLLSDCLSLMPKMMFSGRHFALPDFVASSNMPEDIDFYYSNPRPELEEPSLRRFLEGCPQGMFVTAHARFHPVLHSLMEELQFRHILLLRDPRDVVVSYASFVKREPWHYFHKYYNEILKSDEERITATIRGFGRSTTVDYPLVSIGELCEGFIAWLEDPHTLVVRFEDIIGPRGGGDSDRQLAEIKRLGDFVERSLSEEQAKRISEEMYGGGGLTFRKGLSGDWQNQFTECHRQLFKETTGDLLIKLGYEKDMRW